MFLLLGHGYWGKNIARTFNKELYAICESNHSIHPQLKELYPHAIIYDNFDLALNDVNIKAVLIATKAATHFDFAKKAIVTGKHVWIEKPACTSLTEINELIVLSENMGVKVFVDHIMCHDSTIQHIKENIDFGEPLYFESYRLHQGLFQPDVDVLYDLAIHDLSIIDFLFPNQKLISKTEIKNYHVNILSDHAIINLKFESGFRATITCSWVSPIKQRQIFIAGSKLLLNYLDGRCNVLNIDKPIDENFSFENCKNGIELKIKQMPGLEMAKQAFINGIANNDNMISDIYQARRIQKWLE
jgi:predicted dehydrogenase